MFTDKSCFEQRRLAGEVVRSADDERLTESQLFELLGLESMKILTLLLLQPVVKFKASGEITTLLSFLRFFLLPLWSLLCSITKTQKRWKEHESLREWFDRVFESLDFRINESWGKADYHKSPTHRRASD